MIAVHGTHVPGPVERLRVGDREGVVAWSLGNFLSDMGSGATPSRRFPNLSSKWEAAETRESLVMRIELTADAVSVSFLPTWMSHNRWIVRNGVLDEPLAFELLPMAACGPAVTVPSHWPAHWRAEMIEWVGARREHLFRVSGLAPPTPCTPGVPLLLPL